jgi:ABC-type transport system substrate-binding protein
MPADAGESMGTIRIQERFPLRRTNNKTTTQTVGRGFLTSSLAILALVVSGAVSAAATITQQPQDVKAAVEWLPANLANTPTTFTPLEVTFDAQINSGEILWLDLTRKGNRVIISGDNHSSGTTFDQPVDVVLNTVNGHLIVLDRLRNELIGVDPASGSHAILSSLSVGSGPVFSNPGNGVLDATRNHKGGCHG